MTLEVPDEFIREFEDAWKKFQKLHSELEEMYRLQEGLSYVEPSVKVHLLDAQRGPETPEHDG